MRSGRLNAAWDTAISHLDPPGSSNVSAVCGHYISTSRPTSTTSAGGTPKYAAGRLALR